MTESQFENTNETKSQINFIQTNMKKYANQFETGTLYSFMNRSSFLSISFYDFLNFTKKNHSPFNF